LRLWDSPLRNARTAALLSACLGALIYANALRNDFAYDDLHIVLENQGIHSLSALPEALIKPYWPGPFGRQLGLWRPTTTALLGLQYAVAGENPLMYHAVNLVAHAAVTAVVVLLLSGLMSVPAALLGGLVFAVHPVHVEAVANVIGIAEVAPALLYLLACLIHLRGPETTSWRRAVGIALLYALAFGGKESAVTLPGVLFLLDACRTRIGFGELGGYLRRRWRLYFALTGVAACMLWLRLLVLGSVARPFGPLGADLLTEIPRIWTLAEVWSHYVRLMVFPLDLSSDYSPNVIPISIGWGIPSVTGLVLALSILVASLVAWRQPEMGPGRDSARATAFGVVWFIITISPVSNVLFLSGVLLAERTLYLPSVGLAAAAGWLLLRIWRERRFVGSALLVGVLGFMSWRTWDRNPTWRDNVTVFGTLIEDYPHSGRSQWVLGDLFFQRGNPRQGMVSYRAAINILGTHYQLMTEISKKLIAEKYYDAAERLLLFALKDHPEYSLAPALLAVVYSEKGMPEETERYARMAIDLDEDDPVRHHLLAWALTEQGRWEEAVEARRGAIEHGEGDYWQQWVALAYLQAYAGDTVSAVVALDSARAKTVGAASRRHVDSLSAELLGARPEVPPGAARDGR
jgi:tetratricopeptide (TPR) repeat protein